MSKPIGSRVEPALQVLARDESPGLTRLELETLAVRGRRWPELTRFALQTSGPLTVKIARSALIAFGLLAAVACGGAPNPGAGTPGTSPRSAEDAALAADLDRVVTKTIAGKPMAGVSVTVVRRGVTLLSRGYGLADVERRTPVTADTVFRIGSVTKQFTAVAILKLADAGKLAINDPVTKYLPDYDTHGKTITLRHLLTHTSGIKDYTEMEFFAQRLNQPFSRQEMVQTFGAEPLQFEPGARWSYSNSGYYLLGLVIEKITGEPYADAVRELAIAPAGLAATAYCPPAMTAAHEARGYTVDGGLVKPAEPLDMAHPYAAGALCATAPDLARWLLALVDHRAVSAAEWKQMTTPVTLADGNTYPYGFGLKLDKLGGHAMVGHGGGINGFVSALAAYPDDGLVIAVLVNAESRLAPEIAEALARAALRVPEARPYSADAPGAPKITTLGPNLTPAGVVFNYRDEPGKKLRIYLAGNFNGWNPSASDYLMTDADGDGIWTLIVKLAPGEYQYKYVIDGKWTQDQHAPGDAPDGFGGRNSKFEVQ